MTDEERKALVERLMRVGERIAIPCPDGIKGCAVLHYRVETDPACKEAADQIEADGQRIAELEARLAHAEDDCNDDCIYCEERRKSRKGGVSDLAPGIVSPETKLDVIEVPRDAMGTDPKERMRITASGAVFHKRDDGSVFTIGVKKDG